MGLALSALVGWWWPDAILAIVISLLAFREGRETLVGDDGGSGQVPEPRRPDDASSDPADRAWELDLASGGREVVAAVTAG